MLIFYKQQSYFSQIVSKKAKITILFLMTNSLDGRNTNEFVNNRISVKFFQKKPK